MKKFFIIIFLIFNYSICYGRSGTNENGDDIEIEKGNLVRKGKSI